MKTKWIVNQLDGYYGVNKQWTCNGWKIERFNSKSLNDSDVSGSWYDLYTPSGKYVNEMFYKLSDAKFNAEQSMQ